MGLKKLILIGIILISIPAVIKFSETNPESFSYDPSIFKNGDIIFTRGTSWRSYIVLFFESTENDFSHLGIVKVDKGKRYVIHATPDSFENGTGNSVTIQKLDDFLSPENITEAAIYRLKNNFRQISDSVVYNAQSFAQKTIPFDHKFDLSNSKKMYCTELIYLSFQKAGINLIELEEIKSVLLPSDISKSSYLKEIQRIK